MGKKNKPGAFYTPSLYQGWHSCLQGKTHYTSLGHDQETR